MEKAHVWCLGIGDCEGGWRDLKKGGGFEKGEESGKNWGWGSVWRKYK